VGWANENGFSTEQLLREYPSLSLCQVHAALAYFYANRADMERHFVEDEEAELTGRLRPMTHALGR
jgi:hypothetical protein